MKPRTYRRKKLTAAEEETWTPPTPVPWEVRFAALERFKDRHGHCRVPMYYADDPKLGLWLMNQRQLWKKNKLLPERREALGALGVALDGHEVRWEIGLEKLLEFQREHGHTRVPYLHRSAGYPLGRWAGQQREKADAGTLTPEHRLRLEAVGFDWDLINKRWEQEFARLLDFHRRHGHFDVPNGEALGWWVGEQRRKHRAGTLHPVALGRLTAAGFEWTRRRRRAAR